MTSPRNLMKDWNVKAKKGLGQNFLADPSTGEMIASHCGLSTTDVVLEIGAGLGGLTFPLARRAGRVIAVEKDRELIRLLQAELLSRALANVEVMPGDMLRMDIADIAETSGREKIVVAGNLPYNISSQILVQLVHARRRIRRAVVMLQRELAQRLTAPPGGRDYGRLSVMLQYCAEVRSLATVGAAMFFPRPKVDSEVLGIRFFDAPILDPADERFLFRVVKAAFGKRRKTLKNALSASELNISGDEAQEALFAAGIDPVRRAETLSVDEFVRLSHHLSE